MNEHDIWELQSPSDIIWWFNFLRKDLVKNNTGFFHYTELELEKYKVSPELDIDKRLLQFTQYWNNFNNSKRSIARYFMYNRQENLDIFGSNQRIVIDEIELNYKDILDEINVLNINNKVIPYEYEILLKKLIKSIVIDKALNKKHVQLLDINLKNNLIHVEYTDNINEKIKVKSYKLCKFISKYQSAYPDEYKLCKAWLIVSRNWQDIFLQSTFKQWVSCMNLINCYSNNKIKYTCENQIKSRTD